MTADFRSQPSVRAHGGRAVAFDETAGRAFLSARDCFPCKAELLSETSVVFVFERRGAADRVRT
jgi:hypothetical protein